MRDASATVRALLRSPGYAQVVVLTLALTIGANSAIYSAVRAVLLRPLDIRPPEEYPCFDPLGTDSRIDGLLQRLELAP